MVITLICKGKNITKPFFQKNPLLTIFLVKKKQRCALHTVQCAVGWIIINKVFKGKNGVVCLFAFG